MSECKHGMASEEQTKIIRDKVAENPSIMVRDLARQLGISQCAVTAALPEEMIKSVPVADFIPVWEAAASWEKVTFMAETPGAILEIAGKLPKGKMGHGMYNLMDKKFALGGHLLVSELAAIWLVSKPVFSVESHSIHFFTQCGATAFSLYLGRDDSRSIIPSVKEGYMHLWNTY